jgi:hypothetical protein
VSIPKNQKTRSILDMTLDKGSAFGEQIASLKLFTGLFTIVLVVCAFIWEFGK